MSIARRALGTAGVRTPLARTIVRVGAHVGVTPYNWQLLRSTRHLAWHVPGFERIPCPEWHARQARGLSCADVALCERLIAAYDAALGGRPAGEQVSGMWGWIYEQHQRELAEVLERRDAPALARALAVMFRRPFVHGMAPGALVAHSESVLGRRVWRTKALDGLASLAQALGVAAVAGPEQGAAASVFDGGLGQLVGRIESQIGLSIDFPEVGAAFGLQIDGRLITIESPEQIYSAVRLEQAIASQLHGRALAAPRIVEIGGGYGAMCLWFLRGRRSPERYVMVDLPIVNVLQGYFLSQALGADAVSLLGEPAARVVIVPDGALESVDAPFDVLVNKDSMPEMPAAAVHEYLRWASLTCDGIFFSCNQESTRAFLGERQGLVRDAVASTGAFARLRRDESWVRRGYVEEIYARTDNANGAGPRA